MKPIRTPLLFLWLITFFACNKSSKNFDSDVTLFRQYITRFSSGYISASSDIEIELAFSKSDWQPNQELDRNLIAISPNVQGKVIAIAANKIVFKPTEKLDQDQEYNITFHLGKCIKVANELSQFKFTIKTFKQDFRVETNDLQSYSSDWQYLNGVLKTSDNLDFAAAKKLVSAFQNGRPLAVKFNENTSTPTEFRFFIDSINRADEDIEIEIKWDGKAADIDQKGNSKFSIPGKNNFSVIKLSVIHDGRDALHINFSDPLKANQVFDGLVAIETASNLTFATDGNLLKVFYENDLSGNLLVEVFEGIENTAGFKLKNGYSEKIAFEQLKPAVEFVKSGTILPSANNLSVNFKATSISAVDVRVFKIFENNVLQFLQENTLNGSSSLRKVSLPIAKQTIQLKTDNLQNYNTWNTYSLNLANLIKPEQGAIYRVELSFKKQYSLFKCEEQNNNQEVSTDNDEESEEDNGDSDEYNDYYDYDYEWSERENPCHSSYYYNRNVATNILATDLGVIAKRSGNNSFTIFVNNILTTSPVSGASVEIFNYQKQSLSKAETNREGKATFELGSKAFFAVIKKDVNTTYIRLDDGYSQSVSNFNVDGELIQQGMKGYIYGERGVWRPGDTLFLSFILNDAQSKLPAGHPIKLKLSDPNGKVVVQQVHTYNALNHYKFIVTTASNAPTGNWEAVVSVGGAKFYKSIKIETIKPNRLKIKNSLADQLISTTIKTDGTVDVTWMHGAVAKDLKLEMQAKISASTTTFPSFKNYVFDNPASSFNTEELNLFSGKTNENGSTRFSIQPSLKSNAPGMLKAAIITKVYENGGDFSTDVITSKYSPFSTYIGLKSPELSKYGMLETDKANKFEVVSVDENGKPKPSQNLTIKVYKVEWRWWRDASSNDLSRYTSSTANTAYFSTALSTDGLGKGNFQFTVPEADWGRYLILVQDAQGGHTTGQTFLIDWPSWSGKTKNNNSDNANMLVFSTDKNKYNVGETAKVSFPSSEGCRALVSIENGSTIIETKWVETQKGETKFELPISSKMAPNVYLYITLLQPHSFTNNDLPIRLYGIVPIEVVNQETVLEPIISMPSVLRPEQSTSISVSEKAGKSMSYTLAIVDEGLLDLTRFKTPNAWNSFYAKEALGVKTWDVYDDIIGAFSGKINQIFSIGGDADLGGGKAKKANRFKPVVTYLGPFKLERGAKAIHTIKLPNYIGSVKVMVVAANAENEAYGSAEKVVPVRAPLMILASLPRKVSPTEKIILPITVFAMENQVKNVLVSIKTNNLVASINKTSQTLYFAKPDEQMAYFELQAKDLMGIGKITVEAVSGKEKASYDVEFDVVNPNPMAYQFKELMLEPNAQGNLDWSSFGIKGTNTAKLEISTLPAINLSKRLEYLIQYPHGCVEQTTSSAFPQLYLADLLDIDATRAKNIQRNVTATIQRLMQFQVSNGGFAYWPGNSEADNWGSSYAGHFLIEAEKKGYAIPQNMKANWINYQKRMAREWRQDSYGSDFAQAYRLYSLALASNPDIASMNRLRETKLISNETKLRLALTYAMIGQKNMALSLLNTSNLIVENEHYYFYGSEDRDRAMSLQTLQLLDQKREAFETATKLAKNLSSDVWMSTQTTAYSLMAMAEYAKLIGGKEIDINYTYKNKNLAAKTSKALLEKGLESPDGNQSITLKNNKNTVVFARVILGGILPVGMELEESRGLQVQTNYTLSNGGALPISILRQGTEFVCTITVSNTKRENIDNIALSHIIPSGWEIVNTRYADVETNENKKVDYTDIRDDRTNFYFSLKANESKTFRVSLNASFLGEYYLPGIQCEAMYDNNFFVRKKGQWIKVVKE